MAAAAQAPPYAADSLRAVLRRPALPVDDRLHALLELAWAQADAQPDSARAILRQALALARRTHHTARELEVLNDLGRLYNRAADYLTAQKYLQEAIVGARRTGNRMQLARAYGSLGMQAFQQQDFRQAAHLLEQKLVVLRQLGGNAGAEEPLVLAPLANAYLELGRASEAGQAFRRALALDRLNHNELAEFQALTSYASGLRHRRPDSAAYYAQQAMPLARRLNNPYAQAYAHLVLMQIRQRQQRWAEALALAGPGIGYARQCQSPDYESEMVRVAAEALRRLGRGEAAYDSLQRATVLLDSLFGQERSQELARQQTRFDVAQQQARIHELEQVQRVTRREADRQSGLLRVWVATAGSLGLVIVAIVILAVLLGRSRSRLRRSEAEARRAETAARAANQTKDQLLSIIGHDLRSPVSAFQQVGPMLRHYAHRPDPAELTELADELEGGAAQMGSLLDNLLHWARAQTGEVVNYPALVELPAVLAEVAALYGPGATLKKVTLQTEVPADLHAWADRDLLRTVLRNLVANAVKFTPSGGHVLLRAALEPGTGRVCLAVTDTGVGIAPARAAQLFDAGRAVSTPGTQGEAGTGLGLPLSARFVRLLGDELHLDSVVGQGSRLWFCLPAQTPSNNPT